MATQHQHYPVEKTEDEWRRILTPEQYAVLREHATERRNSCALLNEKRHRHFHVRRLRSATLRGRP